MRLIEPRVYDTDFDTSTGVFGRVSIVAREIRLVDPIETPRVDGDCLYEGVLFHVLDARLPLEDLLETRRERSGNATENLVLVGHLSFSVFDDLLDRIEDSRLLAFLGELDDEAVGVDSGGSDGRLSGSKVKRQLDFTDLIAAAATIPGLVERVVAAVVFVFVFSLSWIVLFGRLFPLRFQGTKLLLPVLLQVPRLGIVRHNSNLVRLSSGSCQCCEEECLDFHCLFVVGVFGSGVSRRFFL
mmetsp:Transcript_30829/g.51234  ORF Transcript_30829/g.51234 Transcript_30829/m.51234 type:complete len:242 (+) Transcript_30829:1612-2337(+)